MPLLFALGQHRALEAIHERMRPGKHVMAFLDDIYTACRPERLAKCARLWTNNWPHTPRAPRQDPSVDRGGVETSGIEEMTRAARALKPEAVVWRGDPLLPAAQQGVKVLGIPVGKQEYVQELAHKTRQQQVLFQRIWVNDTSAFRLIWLRAVKPEDAEDFARGHDENVWAGQRQRMSCPPCH